MLISNMTTKNSSFMTFCRKSVPTERESGFSWKFLSCSQYTDWTIVRSWLRICTISSSTRQQIESRMNAFEAKKEDTKDHSQFRSALRAWVVCVCT